MKIELTVAVRCLQLIFATKNLHLKKKINGKSNDV